MSRRLPWLFVVLAGLVVAGFVHVAGGLEGLGLSRGGAVDSDADLLDADGEDVARDGVRLGGQGEALRSAAGDAEASAASEAGSLAAAAAASDPSAGVVVAFGGVVKDSDGRPVVEGRITLHGYGGAKVVEFERAGRFQTELRPGRYDLHFDSPRHGGLLMRAYLVDGASGADTEFVLREAVQLQATVLRDGVGVADVAITLEPPADVGEQVATTDASGIAFFERVIAGDYTLVANTPEGATLRQRARVLQDTRKEIRLPPGVAVEGTVKDAESGVGVADATVTATVRASGNGNYTVTGSTDVDGRYAIDVPQGRVTDFRVVADGYAPWPPRKKRRSALRPLGSIAKSKPAVVDATLTQGLCVEGRVTDPEGEPVQGVELRFSPRRGSPLSATSDEEGRYVLEGAERQRYTVVVMTEGWFTDKRLNVSVPALAPGEVHVYDVQVRPTLSLTGFVYYGKDKPATAARVWVTGGDHVLKSARGAGRDLETFTDRAGFWRLTDLPANQTVRVRASIGTLEARPTTVRTSALPDKALALRLRATVTVRGRVFDLDTRRTVAQTTVRIQPRGAPAGRTARVVRTDAAGEYVAYELIPGGWNFLPLRRGYLPAVPQEETLASDDETVDVDLMLDPGRAIAGTVADTAGRRLLGAWVRVEGTGADGKRRYYAGRSDAQGAFRVTGLPAGSYGVRAGLRGYRSRRLVDIQAGTEGLQVALKANTAR